MCQVENVDVGDDRGHRGQSVLPPASTFSTWLSDEEDHLKVKETFDLILMFAESRGKKTLLKAKLMKCIIYRINKCLIHLKIRLILHNKTFLKMYY